MTQPAPASTAHESPARTGIRRKLTTIRRALRARWRSGVFFVKLLPMLPSRLLVVPFGVDHPQVPRLGEALARAGFAARLYWSPSMRDLRLDPADPTK